mgnify:CR=1 FL=1
MKKFLLFITSIVTFAGYSQTFDNIPVIGETSSSRVLINKLIASPGGPDLTNEYYEVRGTPNAVVPSDLYLIAIEGDGDAGKTDMGRIRDAVQLGNGSTTFGSNGILALVANYTQDGGGVTTNPYSSVISASANVIVIELAGPNVTSGSSSAVTSKNPDIGYDGNFSDQGATYMLIQVAATSVEDLKLIDIDSDDDGIIDNTGSHTTDWTLHDSVSCLDYDDSIASGDTGEYGYGQIVFARNYTGNESDYKTTTSANVIHLLNGNPVYILRQGTKTGFAANDWIGAGSGAASSAPNWKFSSSKVSPVEFASYEMPNSIYGELNPTAATLSVNNNILASKVAVYPNPAHEYITISTSEQIISIEIFDMLGKNVLKSELVKDRINVSNLTSGIYMLKFNGVNSSSIKKFIIK